MFRFTLFFGSTLLLSTFTIGCGDRPNDDIAGELPAAEAAARTAPSAEAYTNLSMRYFQAHNYTGCLTAASEAIRLKPESPVAYNNQAACYGSLNKWDEEIASAREAVRLSPDFQLAKNNLAWAESQKKAEARSR
jgi:tetratricopeptide (TPR) repeat protein